MKKIMDNLGKLTKSNLGCQMEKIFNGTRSSLKSRYLPIFIEWIIRAQIVPDPNLPYLTKSGATSSPESHRSHHPIAPQISCNCSKRTTCPPKIHVNCTSLSLSYEVPIQIFPNAHPGFTISYLILNGLATRKLGLKAENLALVKWAAA